MMRNQGILGSPIFRELQWFLGRFSATRLCFHRDCNIQWDLDPVEQFLWTSRSLFTIFEVSLAHGVILLRHRAGLSSLMDWTRHSEPNLQSWQLDFTTRDQLRNWALEALSFGAENPPQLVEKAGFLLLWHYHRDLAATVYLLLQLRSCAPGLVVGRVAGRLVVPPIQAARSLVEFLQTVPRWLRRSLYRPVPGSSKSETSIRNPCCFWYLCGSQCSQTYCPRWFWDSGSWGNLQENLIVVG